MNSYQKKKIITEVCYRQQEEICPPACGIIMEEIARYLQKKRKYGAVNRMANTTIMSSYSCWHKARPGSIKTTSTSDNRNRALAGAPFYSTQKSLCQGMFDCAWSYIHCILVLKVTDQKVFYSKIQLFTCMLKSQTLNL